MGRIVDIQMVRLAKLLEERKIAIKLDAKARDWLAEKGYDPAYGARPLKRAIQKAVQDPLAELILSGKVKDGEKVAISADKQGITFNGEAAQAGGVSRLAQPARLATLGVRRKSHAEFSIGVAMSYVNSVLQPGERVVMRGHLHWIVYWHAILLLRARHRAASPWERPADGRWLIAFTAIAFGVLFVVAFMHAWFIRWITEIAVTDRRIIYKRGFINRHTVEMNMDKVASVDVDQSILGRMLDYGTVHVIGTGGAQTTDNATGRAASSTCIGSRQPLALRSAITAK